MSTWTVSASQFGMITRYEYVFTLIMEVDGLLIIFYSLVAFREIIYKWILFKLIGFNIRIPEVLTSLYWCRWVRIGWHKEIMFVVSCRSLSDIYITVYCCEIYSFRLQWPLPSDFALVAWQNYYIYRSMSAFDLLLSVYYVNFRHYSRPQF